MILGNGKLLVTPNKVYAGVNKIDLTESVPSGIIAMWSGASDAIPSGWVLCNGENNTPDLRNRFIVGAGSRYSVGNTGGSDSVTLTTEQLPSHSHGHNLSTVSAGSHTHTFSGTTSSSGGSNATKLTITRFDATGQDKNWIQGSRINSGYASYTIDVGGVNHTHTYSGTVASNGSHTHTFSGTISATGSGGSHENRPPYYALCFIMKS